MTQPATVESRLDALEARVDETRLKVNAKVSELEVAIGTRVETAVFRAELESLKSTVTNELTNTQLQMAQTASRLDAEFTKFKDVIDALHVRLQKVENAPLVGSSSRTDDATASVIVGSSKPPVFDSQSSVVTFLDWNHKLKVYVNGILGDSHSVLQWTATQTTPTR